MSNLFTLATITLTQALLALTYTSQNIAFAGPTGVELNLFRQALQQQTTKSEGGPEAHIEISNEEARTSYDLLEHELFEIRPLLTRYRNVLFYYLASIEPDSRYRINLGTTDTVNTLNISLAAGLGLHLRIGYGHRTDLRSRQPIFRFEMRLTKGLGATATISHTKDHIDVYNSQVSTWGDVYPRGTLTDDFSDIGILIAGDFARGRVWGKYISPNRDQALESRQNLDALYETRGVGVGLGITCHLRTLVKFDVPLQPMQECPNTDFEVAINQANENFIQLLEYLVLNPQLTDANIDDLKNLKSAFKNSVYSLNTALENSANASELFDQVDRASTSLSRESALASPLNFVGLMTNNKSQLEYLSQEAQKDTDSICANILRLL